MKTSIGSWQNFLHTTRICLERVAEYIMTCFWCGVARKISCTSRRISRASSMRSHSSRTKCLSLSSFMNFLFTRSSTRPGVPTTTCGVLFSRVAWFCFTLTPPKKTSVFMSGRYLEKRSYSPLIWYASSRVWQSTRTEISPSTGSIWWRVASTNTAVLPIPDLAWQMMSMPSTACGMHSCCTSDGCSKPQSTTARSSSGLRMKSRKPDA
mmetsp:Transcript_361/g.886  ORF Transcript_361/g.886 Transcript_361/m.886 type:complete len:209 (-) Transcript_361:183-809(-)